MNVFQSVRRHLGRKLFLSYLVIIMLEAALLLVVIDSMTPNAFERHLAHMVAAMGWDATLTEDLFADFHAAVMEAVIIATIGTSATAIALSLYASRRVVSPVQEMVRASGRIAAGHYAERVDVSGRQVEDELGELARSFNRMAEALEQTEARRRQLIGDVAHELRTPLASIQGYMEGLIDGVLPADQIAFQKVRHEADRLQRLVHDLQDLSRVEAGAYTLDLKPLSVAALSAAVADRLRPQFEGKAVTLEVDPSADLPAVLADQDRIFQVLVNLLGNALQYTPAGGRVTLCARREENMVRILVADTGIGIAAEHLPHLFERFYRVDRSRSRAGGGSGLGLTIAKYLVEAQGGEITVASDGPHRGSTFTFTVPIA